MYDFIVIGAGIAGASVAYELARSGRVCVLEREARPGIHSTGRSAALFAPSYGGPQIRALTRASRAFFDAPPARFCEQSLLSNRGCLYIARADQQERLHRMAENLRASGADVAAIRDHQAFSYVPLLRRTYVADAVFDPQAMDIDVDALHQGFLRGARAAGASFITNAHAIRGEMQRGIWMLELGDTQVTAPIVINAAGAWADEVAVSLGTRPIGLEPRRRTALIVEPPAGVDVRTWPAVIDADEQFYFKPEAGKLLLSPADETPDRAGDTQPDDLDIALGVHRVESALDIDVRKVAHAWAGLRTFAPDRLPVIGFDRRVSNLFWCAGQGGYGIQTAPALGRTSAALVMRQPLPADVLAEGVVAEELSPYRFDTTGA
jgi:D-arginine dehydrogenase